MATKKTPLIQDEIVTEEEKTADIGNQDPWTVYETIKIPRHKQGEEEQHYVCINDRKVLVALDGKDHRLPLPIAAAMKDWMAGQDAIEEYMEQIPNDTFINGIPVV